MHEAGKYLIAAASLTGLLVFAVVFVATLTSRPMLEDAMSGFVRWRGA